MLRGFAGRGPFDRVGGEAPMPEATSTSREGLIVGLSFFMAINQVAPMSSGGGATNDILTRIPTVEQYLPTVARPDVCYFSVTLATHLKHNRVPASRHVSM